MPLLWIISRQPHAFPAQLLTLFMFLPFLPVAVMTFFSLLFIPVDIWSVGCIMAEMINGKTLFKGKDCIFCVTGFPRQARRSAVITQVSRTGTRVNTLCNQVLVLRFKNADSNKGS